jgi:hypothetical protein
MVTLVSMLLANPPQTSQWCQQVGIFANRTRPLSLLPVNRKVRDSKSFLRESSMNFLSGPQQITLKAETVINIVGRVDQQSTWGKILLGSPLDWSFGCILLLHPHVKSVR